MELQVVTAFFKINREAWRGFNRTDEEYLDYFKVWGKLKNKIVIYVETETMRDYIISFRSKLGLQHMTIVNVIDDCTKIDIDLFEKIKIAANNPIQQLFRLYPHNPESWNPYYNYVTLLKAWCVADAVKRKQVDGIVAWVDFGFNHGDGAMSINSDFNFCWEYDFSNEKMTIFVLQNFDDKPMFDIFFNMDSYIAGGVVVGPSYLWDKYWNLLKQSTEEMYACGLTDDEQNVILMAYRKEPGMFVKIPTEWTKAIYQCGGGHLIWKKNYIKENFFSKYAHIVGRRIRHYYICVNYALRIFNHMRKVDIK